MDGTNCNFHILGKLRLYNFSIHITYKYTKRRFTLSQVLFQTPFCLTFSIIINTFVPKLCSSSRIKKVQITCFEKPPGLYRFRFQYTTKYRKSTGILHCSRFDESTQMIALIMGKRCKQYQLQISVRILFLFLLTSLGKNRCQ